MHIPSFPTQIDAIFNRINEIDPIKYAKSRNYQDGAVSYLSPYISRGVISLGRVYEHVMHLEISWEQSEKFIQELAWRAYWQTVWKAKGDAIFSDLKSKQAPVNSDQIPTAIINAETGIKAVDDAIKQLYQHGYMHNHMRMYVASICCNIAKCHWSTPAKWMYSLLLDGDLASNHLSWQWVAGSNSNKKYYANQENINRVFYSNQENTFLDKSYEELMEMDIPQNLLSYTSFELDTQLPNANNTRITDRKSLVYNSYNLDPFWHENDDYQRILLLEPSHFKKYPVSNQSIEFVLKLAKNIPNIIIFVGEFNELLKQISPENIIYKEHPLTSHYQGKEESKNDLCSVSGYFPSFFKYWKACKKELISDT